MDGRKANKGVKGNKGGTGRPCLADEKIRALVINKSWERILNKFDKKEKTAEDERQLDIISLEIAKKTIPQKLEGDLNGNFVIKWEDK